jgi:hypothetical protein
MWEIFLWGHILGMGWEGDALIGGAHEFGTTPNSQGHGTLALS